CRSLKRRTSRRHIPSSPIAAPSRSSGTPRPVRHPASGITRGPYPYVGSLRTSEIWTTARFKIVRPPSESGMGAIGVDAEHGLDLLVCGARVRHDRHRRAVVAREKPIVGLAEAGPGPDNRVKDRLHVGR